MNALRTILAAAFFAIAAPAAAQVYVWAGIANADVKLRVSPNPSGADLTVDVGVGYQFTRHFGAELTYIDLPSYGSLGATHNSFWTATGYSAAATARFPLSAKWDVVGKAGVMRLDSEFTVVELASRTSTLTKTNLGSRPLFGIGVQYVFDQTMSVRVMFQRVEGKDGTELDNLSVVNATLMYAF